MSRLTRDGAAEPVSRDQILRHARGQGNIIFPVQLTTSRIGNRTRLIHTLLYVMTIHTCRQETTRLHAISCSKTGWSSLTHNRVLHQALARSLRESKVQFVVEDTWPFRQRASEQNGRLNPLRGGHSSTTTLDSRIRHFYSTLQSSTLAPAPIWGMQHAM